MAATLQSQLFSASGTFNVPTGVTLVWLTGVASGGAGGSCPVATSNPCGAGGSGESCFNKPYPVASGAALTVTIGAAGVSSLAGAGDGGAGANLVFDNFVLQGGQGGKGSQVNAPGGSGGGSGGAIGAAGVGQRGTKELPISAFGGSSGGAGSNANNVGGPCGPYLGGATGGVNIAGGGAASWFGTGGAGTNGLGTNDAPATSLGAGGGGCGAVGGRTGGAGALGQLVVAWSA